MSYGISSDEVAEDYRKALEDLTMNSRYEISNLTIIAKENTEHALAISEALRDHIKMIAPVKKLPAFYVLDSVVKNVGTPYTLFFGRNLYSTFMEAYALVDNNVRRKMEEMLKTWKESVPGSSDTRPVFPIEVTRPIENALIKARTSALQAQHEYARSQQQSMRRPGVPSVPYRDTPTPPGAIRQSQYPPAGHPPGYIPGAQNPQQYSGGVPQYGQVPYSHPQPQPSHQYPPAQSATPSWQQPQPQAVRVMDDSLDTLNRDIANLITTSKAEFAQSLYDGSIQTRLKALLDLQNILQSQRLPQDQLVLIRNQVTALSTAKTQPLPAPMPASAPVVVSQPTQQPTLASLLGDSGALAALLARSPAARQTPTPPASQHVHPVRSPEQNYSKPHNPPVSSAPPPAVAVPDPQSLLEKLRAAGMLPAIPVTNTPAPNLPAGFFAGFPTLQFLNQSSNVHSQRTPLAEIPNDVQLKPNSLKIPRPHLISLLYGRLGLPCTQCGRRFQADEEGKKKKAAHMDWHFKVHQRLTDAEKRGQHRSWYVDEMDWIKSRESADDYLASAVNGSSLALGTEGSAGPKMPKLQWLPVPDDPNLANSVCPIDQERFEMKWLDEAQEFVWMDAIKVGDRIYHASCYGEAKKDGAGTPAYQRNTPEPVLGKRKNEDDHMVMRAKIKTELVS